MARERSQVLAMAKVPKASMRYWLVGEVVVHSYGSFPFGACSSVISRLVYWFVLEAFWAIARGGVDFVGSS